MSATTTISMDQAISAGIAEAARLHIACTAAGIAEAALAWKHYGKALRDLQSGGLHKLAAKRALQQREGAAQAGDAALPVGVEALAGVEQREQFGPEVVERAADALPDLQIDAVQQLEHDVLADVVQRHDEHATRAIDVRDGAAHVTSPAKKAIVAATTEPAA